MIAGPGGDQPGEIAIGGRVVNNVPPKDRDIAMVFQNYALYPHMTVKENMAFSLKLAKAPKNVVEERVGRAAEILGLTQLLERYPRQLSGGQRPARRDGPRHRARPAGVPVRRAALEPGREAPRADAAPRSRSCTSGSRPPRSTSPTTRSRP
jgi:hypothetical protein